MATAIGEVRARCFAFSGVAAAIKEAVFENFLPYIVEIGVVEEVERLRNDLEKTINEKNYEKKMNEVKNLPVAHCIFNIPKNFDGQIELMCTKSTVGLKGNNFESMHLRNEFKPVYQIEFTNSMIKRLIAGDSKAVDYINQITVNRIFEKLKERYNGGEIIVNLVSDPIVCTKLEYILSRGRDLETPLSAVTQNLYPGNANYYSNIGSAVLKKEWLSEVNVHLEKSYFYNPGETNELGNDIILHQAFVGPFQSIPLNLCDGETEPKKRNRKRKAVNQDPIKESENNEAVSTLDEN